MTLHILAKNVDIDLKPREASRSMATLRKLLKWGLVETRKDPELGWVYRLSNDGIYFYNEYAASFGSPVSFLSEHEIKILRKYAFYPFITTNELLKNEFITLTRLELAGFINRENGLTKLGKSAFTPQELAELKNKTLAPNSELIDLD